MRPWKQTVLGLSLVSLTGSKLVICTYFQPSRPLGRGVSYDEVKSLETEFAFSVETTERDSPDGMKLEPILGTGLAWDNYDDNMDTIDGEDSPHATVGMCYQSKNDAITINEPITKRPSSRLGMKRRQFDGREREIDPYHKQLKKIKFDLSVQNQTMENCPYSDA